MSETCTRCVMDTSDPEIQFDVDGVCNHCREFDSIIKHDWFPDERGKEKLDALLSKIKNEKRNNAGYDCIIGLSGGVDSSFLCLKAKDWGLNPIIVHVDAGWNSELAVSNIEKVVKYCGFDLYTHVINWEEMRDLQLSYLKSGISNQDVPQDHAFACAVYKFAIKSGIRSILSGGNIATESILPKAWHGAALDASNLLDIHRKHGQVKLRSYPTISFFEYYIKYPFFHGMKTYRPLNYIKFEKELAMVELETRCNWRRYPQKHGESLFTKIFQNYYLPTKFGYDKRRPHLSSLIVTGQITRDFALHKLQEELYQPDELELDINYLCKKLRISRVEFDSFMNEPNRSYRDYQNWDSKRHILKLLQTKIQTATGWRLRNYS
jgi:N-acetyl sugar amidotransferase